MSKDLELEVAELKDKNSRLEAEVSFFASRYEGSTAKSLEPALEIDLKELWNIIWDGKWIIIGISFLFILGSVFYALSLPNQYVSTAILAPAPQSGSASSMAKFGGQFSGLASLAGINLGGNFEDKSLIAQEIIKTWGFLETFISDNGIEVEVFAAEGWSSSTNSLHVNPTIYDIDNGKWIRDVDASKGQKAKPNGWELYNSFKDRVRINQDKTTGLINLSVEYYSPYLAKEWVDKLIVAINDHFSAQDKTNAEKSISYLNKKIKETNIAQMQAMFYQLIEEQTKTLMLANVSNEYVLKTISQAKVPLEKSQPRRALICVLGLMLGGVVSILIVLAKRLFFRKI